jgi:hypothetical protein
MRFPLFAPYPCHNSIVGCGDIDIHALRISTRKYEESQKIDNIISNNALDCALMKNINYFPKSLFQLGVVELETSQGKLIKYEFGDDQKNEPTCSQNRKIDKSGYRSERYKHLLKLGQTEIRNLLEKYIEQKIYYISLEQLLKDIDIDEDILLYTIHKSIKPKILINNYYIMGKVYIIVALILFILITIYIKYNKSRGITEELNADTEALQEIKEKYPDFYNDLIKFEVFQNGFNVTPNSVSFANI